MTVNKLEPDNGTPNDELFTVAGMFDGSLYKLLLRMALPMFVGMLTQVTYAIADIFWLSHIDVTNSGIIFAIRFNRRCIFHYSDLQRHRTFYHEGCF